MKLKRIVLLISLFLFSGNYLDIRAQESVPPDGGGSFECKTEILSCGWFSGKKRTVCHSLGDGVQCLCGDSTECN